MIGKIVKGTSFSGCVNYVLKEDKSRLLKAVGVYGSPEEIAEHGRSYIIELLRRRRRPQP